MALVRVLLNILLVVVIAGSVKCDGHESGPECRYLRNMFEAIVVKAHDCAETGFTYRELLRFQRAKTDEEFQQSFSVYCQKQSVVRACFARKTAFFETCSNATYVNSFKFYTGMLETILDIGCSNGGEGIVTFWRGFDLIPKNRPQFEKLKTCFNKVFEFVTDLQQYTVDIPSMFYIAYAETKELKSCILSEEMEKSFKKVVDTFFVEAINKMKCINPEDQSLVLCSTIDVKLLSATNVCDVKTNNKEMSVYDALEKDAFSCFKYIAENEYDFDIAYQRLFFSSVCSSSEDVNYSCLNRLRPYSDQCLNVTQQTEFTVLNQTIYQIFNDACIEGGEHFTDIMLQVYRLQKQSPEHKNAILECLASVRSSRRGVYYNSHNNRFYQELESFKNCFVQKLQGDEGNVNAVNKIYNKLRKGVKCFNTEDDSVVLCEALVH